MSTQTQVSRALGAHWDGTSTTFRVWSPQATHVSICLFDRSNHNRETARYSLARDEDVWAITLTDAPPGTPYGLRAEGTYRPRQGLRFNSAKLLIDPYARAIDGRVTFAQGAFAYPFGDPDTTEPESTDSSPVVPRSIVIDPGFDWTGAGRPQIPLEQSVIYEAHVKGLTKLHPDVPAEIRGTYAGAAHPAVIGYLQELGITAIEFLPIHTHVDDGFLVERGLSNYWGYSTLGFFAPDARFAHAQDPLGVVREFKEMVREYHRAGIEVLLDVVYNHTAESNHLGPTLSFKGLHNSEFYWLTSRDQARYLDLTGTGNTVKVHHPGVTDFVVDSLRYWVTEMGVDGFRFDLAPVIGRTELDFDRHAPIFERIQSDEVLSQVKMIAEPWDVGPGGYQVGGFPDNWSEWNDRYRDVVRSFWRSDDGTLAEMGFRLTGSADFYMSRKYGPCASINFLAAHDGMTLADLIAYQDKRNFANGDNNEDGHSHDVNQYIGPDGMTTDPTVVAARKQRARSLLLTLLVSRGVPMILGGDEFGRTQLGNNNAYCQDNSVSWIDWNLRNENTDLLNFVTEAIALRKAERPLRIDRFPDDSIDEMDPWMWFDETGAGLSEAEWQNPERRAFGIYLDSETGNTKDRLALLFNAGGDSVTFRLPDAVNADATSINRLICSAEGSFASLEAPGSSLTIIGFRST